MKNEVRKTKFSKRLLNTLVFDLFANSKDVKVKNEVFRFITQEDKDDILKEMYCFQSYNYKPKYVYIKILVSESNFDNLARLQHIFDLNKDCKIEYVTDGFDADDFIYNCRTYKFKVL
jgi:hypothetical protein